jgi:hypothetical protein
VTWILARRSDRDGIPGHTVQKIDAKAVRSLPNCNVYVPAGNVRFTSTPAVAQFARAVVTVALRGGLKRSPAGFDICACRIGWAGTLDTQEKNPDGPVIYVHGCLTVEQ